MCANAAASVRAATTPTPHVSDITYTVFPITVKSADNVQYAKLYINIGISTTPHLTMDTRSVVLPSKDWDLWLSIRWAPLPHTKQPTPSVIFKG